MREGFSLHTNFSSKSIEQGAIREFRNWAAFITPRRRHDVHRTMCGVGAFPAYAFMRRLCEEKKTPLSRFRLKLMNTSPLLSRRASTTPFPTPLSLPVRARHFQKPSSQSSTSSQMLDTRENTSRSKTCLLRCHGGSFRRRFLP